MRIDFATLAFGYIVRAGGSTPNWATALGQGRDHKINDNPAIDELLKGMTYSAVPSNRISAKIGKGGRMVFGSDEDSPIVIGALFPKVRVNDTPIIGGQFILIITRDTSASHAGRLRVKYGPSNTYMFENAETYSNQDFFNQMKAQLGLADNACWFVSDISIENQNEVVLKTVIVNPDGPVTYEDSAALHAAWEDLDPTLITSDPDRVTGGRNLLLYGVPGSGKSFTIEEMVNDSEYERVVFHPDYTYSDFIGQIIPKLKDVEDGDKRLSYEFNPGPFTKALMEANAAPEKMFYLVIEEINRGNAPAIFGDVFQLLDREADGSSKYHITNFDIANEVYGDEQHPITIPSNLTILATMNTSDQNVFTLDTAFQRRWEMMYIKNDVKGAKHAGVKIEGSEISWGRFASVMNEEILEFNADLASSEDKQLGAYFVTKDELVASRFPEKALKYLWDDAFKLERDKVFRPDIKSIGQLVGEYLLEANNHRDPIKGVMRAEIYRKMMDMSAEDAADAIDESEIFQASLVDEEN